LLVLRLRATMNTGESTNRMSTTEDRQETRLQVQVALAACEDKKAEDTRILELDEVDSGLSDYFLVTSATNARQAVTIADEIEFRLKKQFGMYANSVEGRQQGEWILLDYVDFVVHVFQTEKRAFYDIERLRKSARPLTPAEFDTELKAELAAKTRSTRSKTATKKTVAKKTAVVQKTAAKKVVVKKAVVKKAVAKKIAAKKTTARKTATKKTAVSKPSAKKSSSKKTAAKKSVPVKKAVKKSATSKKTTTSKKSAASKKSTPAKRPAKKAVAKKSAIRTGKK